MVKKHKNSATYAIHLRRENHLSQEAAARLLNISKNTWIRWEHGETEADKLSLQLLPFLARQECPAPCREARANNISGIYLAPHVASCGECWLMAQYLAKTQRPKGFR
jgi:transcriptional regulator with XRE-family HTH domain